MVEATVKLVSWADWRAVRNQTDPPLVEREHDRVYLLRPSCYLLDENSDELRRDCRSPILS